MSTLTLEPVGIDSLELAPLLRAVEVDLQRRYEDEGAAGAPLDPAAFAAPRGSFLLARLDSRPVGCGGVRTTGPGVGEVKRMYVDPGARGRGVARALLRGLEDAAAGLGLARLVLETGDAQPEAVALYASAGWEPIEAYGEFRDTGRSLCFAKQVG